MKVHSHNKQAFTLIELLVVIAIIGLLATLAVVSFGNTRTKARDAKRLSDIKQIQSALELYFDANGRYPLSCASSNGMYVATWAPLMSKTYISKMPNDPTDTATQYGYYYCPGFVTNGNCGYTNPGLGTQYILATRLENRASSPNSCPTNFAGWDNGSLNYIVGTNP